MSTNQAQRASSPSSTSSSTSSLFPSANAPTSPPPLSNLPPSSAENPSTSLFSPPESQEATAAFTNNGTQDIIMGDSELEPSSNIQQATSTMALVEGRQSENTNTGKEGGRGKKDKLALREEEDENAPGYAWRNRRAREEFNKARDGILDPKWSMKEFGDPFLEQLQGLQPGSTGIQGR